MNELHARPKTNYPAKINVQKSIAAARKSGIRAADIRKLLAGGRLGKTIPDREMRDIATGVKIDRWAMLKQSIAQCDKKLASKDLPDDIWVAISKAKTEYLSELSQLTQELEQVSKTGATAGNGYASPHAFGPRETIGNVAAVQVTIGRAQEQAPVTDVANISNNQT